MINSLFNQIAKSIIDFFNRFTFHPYGFTTLVAVLGMGIMFLMMNVYFGSSKSTHRWFGGLTFLFLFICCIVLLIQTANIRHDYQQMLQRRRQEHQKQLTNARKRQYDELTPQVTKLKTQLTFVTHQLKLTTDTKQAQTLSRQKVNITNRLHAFQLRQQRIAFKIYQSEAFNTRDIWYQRANLHNLS